MKVDVQAVEEELSRIQLELTNTEVRTSLLNLVIFSPDAEQAMANEALNYLLGKRAARVIHIVDGDGPESALEVSARCFIDSQRKGVCFEEIVITNGSDRAGGAPGSWIPLLIRDIPTIVLWLHSIGDNPELMVHAIEQADKFIVDSELSVSLGDDVRSVIGLIGRHMREGVPISDFAWKRLRPVRGLVASAFDQKDRIEWLSEIRHVAIAGQSEIAMWLLGLWMAERLGWSETTLETGSAKFTDTRHREVVVDSTGSEDDCDLSVAIEFYSDQTLAIAATSGGCADIEDSQGTAYRTMIQQPSNGEILLEEVDAMYPDDLHRAALSVLRQHG